MTHNPNHFKTYSPCPSNRKIVVVDGTTTTVASRKCSGYPKLVLKNVLHVPHLSVNLVSIQKLTQDLTCHVLDRVGRLDLPRSIMDSTTLAHLVSQNWLSLLCLLSFSLHQVKMSFSYVKKYKKMMVFLLKRNE